MTLLTGMNPDLNVVASHMAAGSESLALAQEQLDDILRNKPVQERSQARLLDIMDAAREALADPAIGRDRFTTADVARISGCSIGTVYRYFPDRVAILDRVWPERNDSVLPREAKLAGDAAPSLSIEEFDHAEHFGLLQ
jgi:AcrR family transcriptional regulator